MMGRYFSEEEVFIIFTTSPAGLGHIRVTHALVSGLRKGMKIEVVGAEDKSVQFLHRITSVNRKLRKISELFQNDPLFENFFAKLYGISLFIERRKMVERICDLYQRRRPRSKRILIVSTHFGLAHKIASVKDRIIKKLGIPVILCVIVTDDSPQKLWAVEGADYIFVPSFETKANLETFFHSNGRIPPQVIVLPYPVSLIFSKPLSEDELKKRFGQVKKGGKEPLAILVPISGAAVQLDYLKELISFLNRKRIAKVVVVSRDSPYTARFLKECQKMEICEVVSSSFDQEVVENYEKEIEYNVFSLEVTKPSEQSFKALVHPHCRGGLILLFSEPVGRQERDNLNFLRRNGLLPNEFDQQILNRLFETGDPKGIDNNFLERARGWRGICLPFDGKKSAEAICKLRDFGIFEAMFNFSGFRRSEELRSDGVERFWDVIEKEVLGKER